MEQVQIRLDTWLNKDCTIGRIFFKNFQAYTLELPWLNNAKNISCIPSGTYSAFKYKSIKHGEVILFSYVPKRTMIEIHAGNFTRQIEGCCLIGNGIKYLDNDTIPDVINSKVTLAKLLSLLPEKFLILVTRR